MTSQFKVGQIVNAVGIKGELRVYPLTDYKERFNELNNVYIKDEKYNIEKVRYNKGLVILKLEGINDRNKAEAYKKSYLTINRDEARKLPEDTYYIADLIGCEVYTIDNKYIGKLVDVIQNSAQDLYEIQSKGSKLSYIPAVQQFIKKIDIENRVIMVQLIEGLMDL